MYRQILVCSYHSHKAITIVLGYCCPAFKIVQLRKCLFYIGCCVCVIVCHHSLYRVILYRIYGSFQKLQTDHRQPGIFLLYRFHFGVHPPPCLLSLSQEIPQERHDVDRFHIDHTVLHKVLLRFRFSWFPIGLPVNPDLPIVPVFPKSYRDAGYCAYVKGKRKRVVLVGIDCSHTHGYILHAHVLCWKGM